MRILLRTVPALLAFALTATAQTAVPPALSDALTYLRNQRSYTWETINTDPGPVEQRFETRRGTMTTVQQSTLPHIVGSVDRAGDTLLKRDWPDGLRLDTLIASDGTTVTSTPEGWLTEKEILTAQAGERLRGAATERFLWLRRADRPDVRRPDQEIGPFLSGLTQIDQPAPDTFVVRGRVRLGSTAKPDDDDPTALDVTVTMRLRSGILRDYDVVIEGSQTVTRARVRVPFSEHRTVILTYVPLGKVDVPAEAREKLAAARTVNR